MKDVRAVLSEKEQDMQRVRHEIQALLTVIPLLKADTELPTPIVIPSVGPPAMRPFDTPQPRETFSQLLTGWLSG